MRKIILIQHCEAEHHINNMTGGWTDTELTPFGRMQAERIAERLEVDLEGEYRLYTSDFKRARATAEVIAGRLELQINIDRDLREINTGDAIDKTKEWARENRLPREKEEFYIDRREFNGGESWREFYHRVSKCMERICEEDSGNIIIVTHGCFLSYAAAWYMNFSAEMIEKACFFSSPGSISLLQKKELGQNGIVYFNDTSHLRGLREE